MKLQILCIFLLVASLYSESMTLQYLKENLRKNHRLLQSQSLIIDSKRAETRSEGRLPNPSMQFGFFPKNGFTKSKVGFTQVLPPQSQLYFKKKIAIGELDLEILTKEKTLQDLMLQLEKVFFDYHFLYEKRDVLVENLKLLNSWVKLWKTHYSHHDFQYQRLIQLQIDAREIEDQIRSVKDQLPVVYQELLQLAWIDQTEVKRVFFDKKITDTKLKLDLNNNIDLLLIDAMKKKEDSSLKFQKSFHKSNFTIGSQWTINDDRAAMNSGNESWMISLGMELVLDKNRVKSRVDSKRFILQSLQSKHAHLSRDLHTKWSKNLFKMNDSRLQYFLIHEDLLPRTKEALDSIQSNYFTQSKGVDFFSLLEHLRKLLKLSLEMKNQYKNYFQTKAELKRILSNIGDN